MILDQLLASLSELSPHDRSLIERAWERARELHEGQTRKSGEPFFTHCVAVANTLAEMRMDAEAIAAGLLHDTLEDTRISRGELEEEFGGKVAILVDGVSRLSNLPIPETLQRRSNREQLYLRKMMLAMGDDVRVVLVKLADRLHNMRTLGYLPPEKRLRIARETLDIFAPLANLLGIWQFKWELEDLSFRYLQPEAYQRIAASMNERRADREHYLETVIRRLRAELKRYGLDTATISGRPKHIYSIYSKMNRKQLPFEQIYDVRAVRIIVDTTPQCYLALGIVHNLWRPIPSEFDDFIAAPKDNFYQSLHTAVLDSGGKTVEVQIRTREMHEHAEYGIAAHWRYKEGLHGDNDAEYQRRVNFLRRLMEFGPEEEDPEIFVDTVKRDVLRDRVYAFTPRGDICDLPAGATPIDFAYHIHTDIGHRCRGARVHGRLVSLDYMLQTGDQVEILTSRQGGPSMDWLNPNLGYVQTSRARNKVKHWFRRQDRNRHLATGREVLERELRRLGLLDAMTFEHVAGLFQHERAKLDDFLVKIGTGDINGSQIANRILESERQDEGKTLLESLLEEQKEGPALSGPQTVQDGVTVMGTSGLLANLARCCNPMPGDGIVGYITRGRGVSVHRADCTNIRASGERERLVEVSWGEREEGRCFPVPVEITAWDREGLLRDISSVVAEAGVNITAVDVAMAKNMATLRLTVEIHSVGQLTRILSRLEGVRNVVEARRQAIR